MVLIGYCNKLALIKCNSVLTQDQSSGNGVARGLPAPGANSDMRLIGPFSYYYLRTYVPL